MRRGAMWGSKRSRIAPFFVTLFVMPLRISVDHMRGANMKAIKATYADGQITLAEKPPEKGPIEVLVVFPDEKDDPWGAILAEQTPRPAFAKFAEECLDKIAKGKAKA